MNLLARIKLVLSAVVFWLGIAGAVIAIVLAELGPMIDQPVVSVIVAWLLPISTIITTLSLIIRRVTEVIPEDRGLLPVADPIPLKRSALGRDAGAATVVTLGGMTVAAVVLYLLVAILS